MASSKRRQNTLALVAIAAAAFNLRIGVTEVGPLIDQIRADTGMSATLAGALGSIPFLCMGVFAFVGMPLVLRFGARRLIGGSLVLLIAGTVARAVMPTAGLVVSATVPVGIAIALAGLALPGVVKTYFPERTGAGMGAYVAALGVGATCAALTMVPLARALGGWRGAFAVSAIPTVLSIPLWLLLPRAGRASGLVVEGEQAPPPATSSRATRGSSGAHRGPPRLVFLLAAVFGLQSMCYGAITNWIAALYHHAGWSQGAAGFTTALVAILLIPSALIIPALSDRGDRRKWLLGCALAMSLGLFGFAFAPKTIPWVWIVAFGIGNGAMFPLALTLPQDLADDPRARNELTAWMLGLGYALSATGPLLVGGLRDVTGGFTLPMALLGAVGMTAGAFALAPALRRREHARPAVQTVREGVLSTRA